MSSTIKIPGSIWQETDKTGRTIFRVEVDLAAPGDKRQRTRRTAHSRGEAERIKKDLWLKREQGRNAPATQESLAGFAQWWLHNVKQGRIKDSTIGDYEYKLRKYVLVDLGQKRLGEVTVRHIEQLLRNLREINGLSANTVNGVRRVLFQLFAHAVRIRSIHENPVAATAPLRPG